MIGNNSKIPPNSDLTAVLIQSVEPQKDEFTGENSGKQLGKYAYQLAENEEEEDMSSDDEEKIKYKTVASKLSPLEVNYSSSIYSCSSDDDESAAASPIPEDSNSELNSFNIFLVLKTLMCTK